MPKYKKGQVWNKVNNKLMIKFKEETGKNAVHNNKITGQFEYWQWKQTEIAPKPSKPIKTKKKVVKKTTEERHKMPEAGSAVQVVIKNVLGERDKIFYAGIIKEDFIGTWVTTNAFVDHEQIHFFYSLYSGGNTGAGVRPHDIRKFKKGETEFVKKLW